MAADNMDRLDAPTFASIYRIPSTDFDQAAAERLQTTARRLERPKLAWQLHAQMSDLALLKQ